MSRAVNEVPNRAEMMRAHDFQPHGLPRCARKDAGRFVSARPQAVAAYAYSRPGYKSAQCGFIASIKLTFLALDPALSCFSRVMASTMVACNSK